MDVLCLLQHKVLPQSMKGIESKLTNEMLAGCWIRSYPNML